MGGNTSDASNQLELNLLFMYIYVDKLKASALDL